MSQVGRNPPRPTQDGRKISLGATIKEKFRQLAQFLTPREAPAPQPSQRRRRTEDTGRAAFSLAAVKTTRRPAAKLPAAAYAAAVFLADTFDWLNQWHYYGIEDDHFRPAQGDYLYPHL